MHSAASASQTDLQELARWIRLVQAPGVGVDAALRLLRQVGSPEAIFAAPAATLSALIGARLTRSLQGAPSAATQSLIAATLAWCEQPDHSLLTLADARYPRALLDISDPPLVLYVKGRVELLQRTCLAIVGSRNATAQGALNAERFAAAFAEAGVTVVSGMALGIDTAAHQGGLRYSAGSTVAVIGTGIDIVYPARNRALAQRIAESGCLVSEYALGTPPHAGNFPRRNRLISGLSRAVLVIEAAARSGSLITARVAAEQGRDVFAVPGSIHAPLSKGCHELIKQGAKLVESAQDILEEMGCGPKVVDACHTSQHGHALHASDENAALLDALGFDAVDGDTLAVRADLDAAALTSQLLTLELQGMVEVLPCGSYRRVA